MYCTNCGAKLFDDSVFCSKCGTKVTPQEDVADVIDEISPLENDTASEFFEMVINQESLPTDVDDNCEIEQEEPILEEQQSTSYTVPIAKKKSGKKWIFIAGITLAVIIAVISIVFISAGTGNSVGQEIEPVNISARMTEDGTAYIPLMNGTHIKINEEVAAATLTKDRLHIVVLLQDGMLYVTDTTLTEKHNIADNAVSVASVHNDGFIYKDEDENVYRVLFADYSSLDLGKDSAVVTAYDNVTALIAMDDGDIYTLSNLSSEKTKIASFDGHVELEAISNNGQISVWVTEEDDVQTIMVNDGEDKYTLGEVDYKYNYTYVTFTDDQSMVAITNSYSDCMWIKKAGEEPIKVKLGANPESSVIYTENDYLGYENSAEVNSLYVSTESDAGSNVYHISMSGERERVLSKVSDYNIANRNIIYVDVDKTLYYAQIEGASITSEVKLASDVDLFEVSNNGQYVYYMKDCGSDAGSLYCYKIGEDEPQKIASEAACYNGSYFQSMYVSISADGRTVYYFTDLEEIDDTYTDQGTLMMWSYGEKSSSRIASEVINYSVASGVTGGINPKSFVFLKYSSVDSDENIYGNWMYYNGTEATRMATDVIE